MTLVETTLLEITLVGEYLYIISSRWPHCVANILQEFVRDVSTKLMDYLNTTLVQQITPGNVDFGPSFTQIAIAKSLVKSPAVSYLY